MQFISFLQELRTPALDSFFSTITRFGEEIPLILLSFLFFWCINKKYGYYLFLAGSTGLALNLFTKMLFRIPRPWVIDPNFSIVESAREAATGYSFPSGHTQIAVGVYGGIAKLSDKKVVRIFCIILAALVAFSRLYLGVHTPVDVFFGAVLSLILIYVFYYLINISFENTNRMNLIYGSILFLCAGTIIFLYVYPFPENLDMENFRNAIENAYKISGTVLAIWISFIVDMKFTRFETDCVWWGQVLKLIFGFSVALAIRFFLKAPLERLFCGHPLAGAVRYFITAVFVGCLWPMTFKIFPKRRMKF